jgi:2,4-dienoyl-CoA reductase-like NADH-dependent reductase (Old Yellow Enzyme family)
MAHLFEAFRLRGVTFANRIGVSPMCQYSCENGLATDWHFVHLASRAVGGAALVMTEAAAVTPEARISPQDLGAWNETQFEPLGRIARFVASQGSVPGIQLAHAGRKGSTFRPWSGRGAVKEGEGGWLPVAPSALCFSESYPKPKELTGSEIAEIIGAFATAAKRAYSKGFRVIEIHAAHGYLLHEFLSALSNQRSDRYGGTYDNRVRLLCETVTAIREAVPDSCPLFVRISASDWVEGGWDIDQSIELARRLKQLGTDLIDCSSGGNAEKAVIPVGPGYQTAFAEKIRREAEIATAAVGMITSPVQADHIVRSGQADFVFLARELLRNPYWPLHAAQELGHSMEWPAQYLRAGPANARERMAAHEIN